MLHLAGRGDEPRLTEAALPLRRLLGEDVALVGLVTLHLTAAGNAEALLGSLVGLRSSALNGLLFRRENHRHGLPFQSSRTFDLSNIDQCGGDTVEHRLTQRFLGVRNSGDHGTSWSP